MFTWQSGNVYKGEYFEDERHGQGRMEWTDGSVYEGEWQNGIQHGWGKMIYPNGKVKEGIFEGNIFKGEQTTESRRDDTIQSADEGEESSAQMSRTGHNVRRHIMKDGKVDFHHKDSDDKDDILDTEE